MTSTVLSILTCIISFVASAQEQLKIGEVAPNFILKSINGKEYSTRKLRGNIIALIMGNRKIRKEDNKWGKIIQKDFERNHHVATFIIGDMRSVPRFVPKNLIKKHMQKKPTTATLLLDWQGKVHQQYKTQPKFPNLYVISPTGKIIFRKSWKLKPNRHLELKSKIDKELSNLTKTKQIIRSNT